MRRAKAGTRIFNYEKKIFGTVTGGPFHEVRWDNGTTTLRGEALHMKADDPLVTLFTKWWKGFNAHLNER